MEIELITDLLKFEEALVRTDDTEGAALVRRLIEDQEAELAGVAAPRKELPAPVPVLKLA